MINAKKIEDIAKQVTDAIPPGLKNFASDFEEKTKIHLKGKEKNTYFPYSMI